MNSSGPNDEMLIGGWGNYPVERCRVSRPETFEDLRSTVVDGPLPDYIPRGLGRAYGDSSLNRDHGVINQTRLNRLIAFDESQGIVECEAGVSLKELIDVFLPRGWFLPTTPGTKFVTVGGAIAADVHGKNHHVDGSWGNFVLDFRLLTASGEVMTCSPEQNADVFWATIGGMGLTGCIVSARIKLMPVETAYVDVTYRRTENLDKTLEAFEATNQRFRYSVAWIDCLASGGNLGRSVLMLANDAPRSSLPARKRTDPLRLPNAQKKAVPFNFPSFALNPLSVKAFNAAYYGTHPDGQKVVDLNTFYYPLDNVLNWNRIYGRRGFAQYQALFPPETSRKALIRMLEKVAASRKASFLTVLKSTGAANRGLLSFPYPGHTLAMDLANTGEDLKRLLRELDQLVLENGGRLYLAKDSTTTPEVFRSMYPSLPEFQRVKRAVDPNNRFVSSQARRLGIVEA